MLCCVVLDVECWLRHGNLINCIHPHFHDMIMISMIEHIKMKEKGESIKLNVLCQIPTIWVQSQRPKPNSMD